MIMLILAVASVILGVIQIVSTKKK